MDILQANNTKDYLKCATVIGIPIVLQSMVSSCVNVLDVFMLGQLGEVEITAASMGNQWFLLYCILVNGIAASSAMFISQYWGKRDAKSIHHFMGILFYGSVGLSIFFMVMAFGFPKVVLSFYSMDQAVIEQGAAYLRIIGISYLIYAINSTCATALRSIGKTSVPMLASIVSLLGNALGNYVLIFGKAGFPQLGVQGAAIATVIARLLEVSITLGYILVKKPVVYGPIREYMRIPMTHLRPFVQFGSLVILGEAVYAVGNNLYNVAYKFLGTEGQASLQIVQTVQGMSLLIGSGIGAAAAVMLGTMLGNSQFSKAKECSRVLTKFALLVSVGIGALVYLAGPLLLGFFHVSSQTKGSVELMLRMMACSIPLRNLVFMVICGILRSGGDSLYCFLGNLFGVWCFGLPLVFLAAVVFHAPVHLVYLLSIAEEAGKLLICGPRVLKGKWVRNLTNQKQMV